MDRKQRIRFIVNPISGTQTKQAIVELIPQLLDASRLEWEIEYTQFAGHASALAREAVKLGFDVVVAVGGDGTVNEVARALVHSRTALGIVPCGSGNGLARHLFIPMKPEGALRILNDCRIETLDYGTINGREFFCTCGVGFDAFVSEKFAQAGKRGLLTYIENTLKIGLTYKPETYEIEIDGEPKTYKAFLIACANASQYGNNAFIAPSASMSDGLLNVTIMEPFNVLQAPQIAMQLFNKSLENNSHIKSFVCKKVHIHRQAEGAVHFDGDPMVCGADLDVELIAGGIRMVVNTTPQLVESPLLHAFEEMYDKFVTDVDHIRNSATDTQRKIRKINKELLRKLKG
ncbi:MAG: diacylglycerol kinase family lipid kinase [Bacteroidaceae bacterium]|nr:diacylglycerol kinase family lipid kinase [Bacteroidaceae bacterium]